MYCINEASCHGSAETKEPPVASSSPPPSLVVHSTWNESLNEAFPQVLEFRHKWEALGFEVSVTPDEAIRDDIIVLHTLVPSLNLLALFDNLTTNVMKYDVWRYTKLYLDGGVYADVDIEPLTDGRIVDYVKESQLSGRSVLFEESSWPNNRCMRFLLPRLSDYSDLPSYGNAIMISPKPRNAFWLDLLQDLHPDQWRHVPEPRRTLMSTGPGHVTQLVKRRPSLVTLVGYQDRRHVFIHHGFGTWKLWMPKEYWVAYYIAMAISLILFAMLLFGRCNRRCYWLRRQLRGKTLIAYQTIGGGEKL